MVWVIISNLFGFSSRLDCLAEVADLGVGGASFCGTCYHVRIG